MHNHELNKEARTKHPSKRVVANVPGESPKQKRRQRDRVQKQAEGPTSSLRCALELPRIVPAPFFNASVVTVTDSIGDLNA